MLPTYTRWADIDSDSDSEWDPCEDDCCWIGCCHERIAEKVTEVDELKQIASSLIVMDEIFNHIEVYLNKMLDEDEKPQKAWERVSKGARLTRVEDPRAPSTFTTPNPFAVLAELMED